MLAGCRRTEEGLVDCRRAREGLMRERHAPAYDECSASLETRPSPSSTRACSVSYNYTWEYFWREKAWYILSCDACRDCHKASSCGAVT